LAGDKSAIESWRKLVPGLVDANDITYLGKYSVNPSIVARYKVSVFL